MIRRLSLGGGPLGLVVRRLGLNELMGVRVAISKRRSKRLAAGTIVRLDDSQPGLLSWLLSLYSVVDDMVAPFSMQQFESVEEALSEANETLKVTEADWVEIEEGEVEEFIKANTKNRWSAS